MLELNFSPSISSTMFRDATVSVSIVEMNLKYATNNVHLNHGTGRPGFHLRFKRVHIEKAIVQLQGREFRRWGEFGIRVPLDILSSTPQVQRTKSKTHYLFAEDPANLFLEYSREPIIRDRLHGENLHGPFPCILGIMSLVFGKLCLSMIRK